MRVLDTKLHEAPVLSRLKNTMEKLSGPRGNITHLMESDGEALGMPFVRPIRRLSMWTRT
jgi:hypothetical protein